MRKISVLLFMALLVAGFPSLAQNKTMTWTTKSDKARDLALQGADCFKNNEAAQAYDKFQQALELDPNFTVSLMFMAAMTRGATRTSYLDRAKKSLGDKTDGEKMFATLLDDSAKHFGETIAKLHEMFPDGSVIGALYVNSRQTPEEQFKAAQDFMNKFPDDASIYNTMAYMYLQVKKDTAGAKPYFEKYVKMHPDGCNSYDSMGEYYFDIGDMANSEKYYKLALEKYPFFQSSIDKLNEIKKMKEKK